MWIKFKKIIFKKLIIKYFLLIVFITISTILISIHTNFAFAIQSNNSVNVSAFVGDYFLNISGSASPYASIVLRINEDQFLNSTVADKDGYFTFSNEIIKKRLSEFCLIAVDFKKIGISEVCFSFPPAESVITKKDLFLPPTIGLVRTKIALGSSATVIGYTMPEAEVKIISNGKIIKTISDKSGYYTVEIFGLGLGENYIFAEATFKGKDSFKSKKGAMIIVLSVTDQFNNWLNDFFSRLWKYISNINFDILWMIFPLFILILMLLFRLYPRIFSIITKNKFWKKFLTKLKKKKLHHGWFIGY
ncbi:hypothetical protein LBMAG33_7000 [Candidatus Levyibacteriota bacterium]|nr:hypothetical protein [Candidatus Levybacteria bacterium]MSU26085.1 hypothetical protein [Candidatus Levybacteria bacterium]GDX62390.1 hypothetical protein LBMAG33_7000 [Candidatus Levybacteria bacterium]